MQALISCALLSQVTCIHIVRRTCTHMAITRHTWVSRWSPTGLSGWWCYLGWGPCGWAPSQKFQEIIILIKLKLTEKLVEFILKSLPVDRHKWTTTSNFRMGGSVGPTLSQILHMAIPLSMDTLEFAGAIFLQAAYGEMETCILSTLFIIIIFHVNAVNVHLLLQELIWLWTVRVNIHYHQQSIRNYQRRITTRDSTMKLGHRVRCSVVFN